MLGNATVQHHELVFFSFCFAVFSVLILSSHQMHYDCKKALVNLLHKHDNFQREGKVPILLSVEKPVQEVTGFF